MIRQIYRASGAFVFLAIAVIWAPIIGPGQEKSGSISPPEYVIQPPDVHSHTVLLRQELDVLAFEMGEVRHTRPEIRVVNVQPREVYFQALTLLQKSSRLCFEFTQEGYTLPTADRGHSSRACVEHRTGRFGAYCLCARSLTIATATRTAVA
jgi:hypothetical protein